jgi:hypothetical protein
MKCSKGLILTFALPILSACNAQNGLGSVSISQSGQSQPSAISTPPVASVVNSTGVSPSSPPSAQTQKQAPQIQPQTVISSGTRKLTEVGDNFLLSQIPSDSYSQLTLGRSITIPQVPYFEKSANQVTLHPVSVFDGRVIQDYVRGNSCLDTDSGKVLSADECNKISDTANCTIDWYPIKPASVSSASDASAYWQIQDNYVFPIERLPSQSNSFTHSNNTTNYIADNLQIYCADKSNDALTLGDLKKAFGSHVTLQVLTSAETGK